MENRLYARSLYARVQFVQLFFFSTLQIEVLNKHLLLSSKPVIYLVNLSEKDYQAQEKQMVGKVIFKTPVLKIENVIYSQTVADTSLTGA